MSHNLEFDFSVNKENNTITIKRAFVAELSLIWDAFTKSEIMDQWWAPKPWRARTKTMDFREGGHWHYAMVGPEGEEHWGMTHYKIIREQEYIMGLDGFADATGSINKELPQSSWEISFTNKGALTLVQYLIKYDDLDQLEATIQMGFKEGITMAMEGLDELLVIFKK